MNELAHTTLSAWESFYIIVGSSAGALTGLQFVVMALIADRPGRATQLQIDAFATPTILHFCAALLVSAILSAPWSSLESVGWILAACGLAGVIYAVIVVLRARRQEGYRPELEDWIWHGFLPLLAYAVLLVAGFLLAANPGTALPLVAAVSLLLVFIGIHNAWDSITYMAADPQHLVKDPPPGAGTS